MANPFLDNNPFKGVGTLGPKKKITPKKKVRGARKSAPARVGPPTSGQMKPRRPEGIFPETRPKAAPRTGAAPGPSRLPNPGGTAGGGPVVVTSAPPPISSGSPSGAPSNTPATGGVLGGANSLIQGKRKSADLLHQQNLTDLIDFQDWMSKQQDTAEKFLSTRFDASNTATKNSVDAALAAAQKLSAINQQNIIPGSPEAQLASDTNALNLQEMAAQTGVNQNLQGSASQLLANNRSVDNARARAFRERELQMHQGRLENLDNLELQDQYRREQLAIDKATAEALGASNLEKLKLDGYKAETDRIQVLNQAEYNREKLLIDKHFKQGNLTVAERNAAVAELNAQAGITGNAGKMQSGARSVAKNVRKVWEDRNGVFNAKVKPEVQAKLMNNVFLAIQNDYPGITDEQILNAMKAEFGPGAVALLEKYKD